MKTRSSVSELLCCLSLATALPILGTACVSTTGGDPSAATPQSPRPTEAAAPCRTGEERSEGGIVFVRICAGTFTMGSAEGEAGAYVNERPAHQVTLSEYWIAKTETTNAQYRVFRPEHPGENELPATRLSWNDAKAACEHFGGRLPTEAEWEFAARAGSTSIWAFGDDEQQLAEHAWFLGNSGEQTHPVGQKKPNAWGLHDTHGNVWEWVADGYGPYAPEAQTDPTGPPDSPVRVMRGGSALNPPRVVRPAFRQWFVPVVSKENFGFRCAWEPRSQG